MLSPRWRKVLRDLWGNKFRTLLVVLSTAVGVFALGLKRFIADMHANALQLPRSAVVGSDDEPAVFVVEDDVVRRQIVALGFSSGASVEVLDGLTGTEQIVVVGQTGLRDGTRVEVVNADGASTASVPAQSE